MEGRFWLPTFTGLRMDVVEPTADMVCLMDMAHHLSMECRFGNSTNKHYSVAEHSVRMSLLVPARVAKRTAVHDGHETWTGDIPRPVKALLGDVIRQIEKRLDVVVGKKYDIDMADTTEYKSMVELDVCFPTVEAKWAKLHDHPEHLAPMNGGASGAKLAEWAYGMSTKHFPDWGWSQPLAMSRFLRRAKEVGIWDPSADAVPRWEAACQFCTTRAYGIGVEAVCKNGHMQAYPN